MKFLVGHQLLFFMFDDITCLFSCRDLCLWRVTNILGNKLCHCGGGELWDSLVNDSTRSKTFLALEALPGVMSFWAIVSPIVWRLLKFLLYLYMLGSVYRSNSMKIFKRFLVFIFPPPHYLLYPLSLVNPPILESPLSHCNTILCFPFLGKSSPPLLVT